MTSSGNIGDGLKELLRRLDPKGATSSLQAQIAAVWPELAGPRVMSHTTGAHVRGSDLVIYVDSPAWANDLQAMSGQYLEALRQRLGKIPVSRIVFTVSRKVAEEHRIRRAEEEKAEFYVQDVVESESLTEVELAQVTESASRIDDPDLREAVLRATIADLEWKKGIAKREGR